MKMLTLFAVLCLSCGAMAQIEGSDTIEYVHGLPVTGEDTVPDSDNELHEAHLEKIPKQKIPKRLLNTLRDEEIYSGWDRHPVYRNRKTGLYIVTVMESDTTKRMYGFNDNGKVITFDESTIQDQ